MRYALSVALLLGLFFQLGCANGAASNGGPLATEQGAKFPLKVSLKVDPETVYVDELPGPEGPKQPQPRAIKLTLTVTNDRRTGYHGEWQDSGVVRFWVTDPLYVIWASDDLILPVVTPISLQPGESKSFAATWTMKNAAAFVGRKLTAHGVFLPERIVDEQQLRVEVAQRAANQR
jgi:hypothetical protein